MTQVHGKSIDRYLALPGVTGMVCVVGSLFMFTIGSAPLSAAQGVFALVRWPWYPVSALS